MDDNEEMLGRLVGYMQGHVDIMRAWHTTLMAPDSDEATKKQALNIIEAYASIAEQAGKRIGEVARKLGATA